nr:hypothetical protein Hi04_10k_c5981_00043 [uncultured bacterium]
MKNLNPIREEVVIWPRSESISRPGISSNDSNKLIGLGTYLVVGLGLLGFGFALKALPGGARRNDFNAYYACAVALHRGLDPYVINLTTYTRQLHLHPDPFSYPGDTPTFILATEPLALFSPENAYRIWTTASLLCLAASVFMLFGPSSGLNRSSAIILSLAALGFTPMALNLVWSQSQTFLMFGIVLFYRLATRGRDRGAGALLAMLGLLRGFPLALGGFLLVHSKWQAIGSAAIAFVIGLWVTVIFLGVGPVLNFLRMVGLVGGHQWLSLPPLWKVTPINLSLNAFVDRPLMLLFGLNLPPAARTIGGGIVILADVAILAATFRATAQTSQERSLALWTVTMLMITPVVWLYYVMLLIVPFGLIGRSVTNHQTSMRVRRLAMLSYSFFVLGTPSLVYAILPFRLTWRSALFGEFGFLSVFCVWLAALLFATEPLSKSSQTEPLPNFVDQHLHAISFDVGSG